MRRMRTRPPKGRHSVNRTSSPSLGIPKVHESGVNHVTGHAVYVDDIPEPQGTLHVAVGSSEIAHGSIKHLDLTEVINSEGVVKVLTRADVIGMNDIGPVYKGDHLFVDGNVEFIGQTIFAVVALTYNQARLAVKKARIEWIRHEQTVTLQEAISQDSFLLPTHVMKKGDVDKALERSIHQLQSNGYIKGQEHFYLEGQVSLAIPTESGIHVHTSSQHPTEIQTLVAEVLDLPFHMVTAEVRRMGGGFGGKETQAAAVACIAALAAYLIGKPVKYRMPRREDMEHTGKRHDFSFEYDLGFNDLGVLEGVDMKLNALCGCSPDLSEAIVDRAMFHADNGYYLNNAHIEGRRYKTHTVSNTAFRGFGGPQGMVVIESAMDDIARYLGEDPLTVRKRNLYRQGKQETHYGQVIQQIILPELIAQLEEQSDYWQRREAIRYFNNQQRYVKKGLALTPVKFGISFTATHLNQAGALVHVYTDGSILVNHGGTEMGQGLYTKVAQVVANEFGVDFDSVQVSSTRTDKIANTSPTAASSGSDLNGLAAKNACDKIKKHLEDFISEHYQVDLADIHFQNNAVWAGDKYLDSFKSVCQKAYLKRVCLMAHGFYKTPKIFYDRESASGHPFYYFSNGAAVSEVLVDVLTGEYKVLRTDILHDVGRSLNPALDIGQIEGGFIQGMGWLTTEELLWDEQGRVISNSPANYKIPTAFDVPKEFHVEIMETANSEDTVYQSKAVGEPPFMLGISVWCALRDACSSLANYEFNPPLDPPATPERVLNAIVVAREYAKDA